jgi:hypothetical protein
LAFWSIAFALERAAPKGIKTVMLDECDRHSLTGRRILRGFWRGHQVHIRLERQDLPQRGHSDRRPGPWRIAGVLSATRRQIGSYITMGVSRAASRGYEKLARLQHSQLVSIRENLAIFDRRQLNQTND